MDNSASAMDDQDTTLTHQNDGIEYKFEEVVKFVENKVISADGLTLAEVFQALVQMLNGDLELVKKVLACASIMAKHEIKVAKESQLSRADVLRALEGKENVISRQDFIKNPPPTPAVKPTKKKSRGL
jgi:L-fucose mutarotase/ribose pyranase (RbsD/FucU family)